MSNSAKPIARKEGLVIQELNDEVLVYDLETNKAHCLNESAATVWKNCDGAQTITDIAKKFIEQSGSKVDEDFVWLAIDQLNELKLLERELKPNFQGQTRREVLRNIGLASIIALPIVSMLAFPNSALAFTCGTSVCGNLPSSCQDPVLPFCCRGVCVVNAGACSPAC